MKFADDGGKAEDGNLIRFIENTLAKNNMNTLLFLLIHMV